MHAKDLSNTGQHNDKTEETKKIMDSFPNKIPSIKVFKIKHSGGAYSDHDIHYKEELYATHFRIPNKNHFNVKILISF
jgi:hypothetical protein